MLVLTRNIGERIMIADNIVITVINMSDGVVRLGIDAPKEIAVHREEIYDKVQKEKDND